MIGAASIVMKITYRLGLFAALVACLAAGSGTAFSQPVQGNISVYSQASAYDTTLPQTPGVTSTQTGSWNLIPASETANSFATQSVDAQSGDGSATASMSGLASWAPNGDSGAFSFDYTLASVRSATVLESANNAPFGGNPENLYGTVGTPPDWGYEFTATASGDFVLDYDITMTGDTFGLQGFSLSGIYSPQYAALNNGNGYLDTNPSGPTADGVDNSGEYVAPVTAGETYTLSFSEESNFSGGGTDGSGSVTADFRWSLPGASSSVPDGAATLPLLGSACVGIAALRRRYAR